MSIYEITFITKDEKNDDVKKLITQEDGNIIYEKSLGRKKFAYPVKKESAGFYTVIVFEFDNQKLFNLDKDLRMNQEIVRYITISYEKEYSRYELEKKMAELKDPKQKNIEKVTDKSTNKKEIQPKSDTKETKKITDKIIVEEKGDSKEVANYLPESLDESEELKNSSTSSEQAEGTEEQKNVTSDPSRLDEAGDVTSDKKEIKEEVKSLDKTRDKEKLKITSKPKKEAVSEEERLAKLEEKLDELLKD